MGSAPKLQLTAPPWADTYYDIRDVMRKFKWSERKVRKLIELNKIPYYQPEGPGTAVRFDPDELEHWFRGSRIEPKL